MNGDLAKLNATLWRILHELRALNYLFAVLARQHGGSDSLHGVHGLLAEAYGSASESDEDDWNEDLEGDGGASDGADLCLVCGADDGRVLNVVGVCGPCMEAAVRREEADGTIEEGGRT